VTRVILATVFATAALFGQTLTAPGVPNFHQVDEHVYRGAQPTPEGFGSLSKLGIHTVIDLRAEHAGSDSEKNLVESHGMKYIFVPMHGFAAPSDEDIRKVLGIMGTTEAKDWPVFVHCRLGKDRTGTVVACYRIAHHNWGNEKALTEARGYGMSFFQRSMQRYVMAYQAPKIESTQSQPKSVLAPAPAASH
jgi:protein tyrosine/serine phosphatase